MNEAATLAHALEELMCQAVAQEKQLTIRLSVSLEENEKHNQNKGWGSIDPLFMQNVANVD